LQGQGLIPQAPLSSAKPYQAEHQDRGQKLVFCRALSYAMAIMTIEFLKMHGLGNDFVIIDARKRPIALSPAAITAIADRHRGVGCDQLIILEAHKTPPGHAGLQGGVFMRIYNADGGEVGACGNVTRCVGAVLLAEQKTDRVQFYSQAGQLEAFANADGRITVDMGKPRLEWAQIPLARPVDTLCLPIALGDSQGIAVSMGNPHLIFFVPDILAIDVGALGPQFEHHPLFPERTNVEFVQLMDNNRLRVRVWERGAGITQACGTGACAVLVAAISRGLLAGRSAQLELDGGRLDCVWRLEDQHVLMTGEIAYSFTGQLSASFLL
jgi:diaminopimelate epimerase